MKRIFRSLAALLIIVISFSAISFAWLASGKYLNFPSSFGGSATPAYFAGGDGSKDNPFRITNAVHLYNLAWLQYLGYFNRREGFNNDRDQTYFELGKDVDMRGRAIPPIGTEEYPFIGKFNGNGKTVKNLTISNKKGTGDLVYSPTNANFSSGNMLCRVNDSTKTQEIEIVGMFGVTGNYNKYLDTYANTYKGLNKADVNVSNFYVDKIHVRSNSAKTLAGLAAGYIGGNFSNVGVYRSDIKFAANAQANGVAGNGVLSKYSLVGAYNEDLITWDDANTWGGSIDMRTLARRVNYMMATANNVYYLTSAVATFKNDNYHLYTSSQRVKNYIFEYGYNPNGSQSLGTDANLLGGNYKISSSNDKDLYTVLPINVDKSAMGLDSDSETENVQKTVYKYTGNYSSGYDIFYPTETNTTVTFNLNSKYKKAKFETTLNNTGYIVGLGSEDKKTATQGAIQINIRPRTSSSSIKNSFKGNSYDASTFALITYCGDSGFRFIKDSYNTNGTNYTGPDGESVELKDATYLNKEADGTYHYDKVRSDSKFEQYMGIGNWNNIYGLSFNNQYGFGVKNKSTVISYGENGTEKLVTGAINFNVKKEGIITAIVGTYYGSDVKQNAFTLYKVNKDELNVGSSVSSGGLTTVEKIYEHNGKYYINDKPDESASLRYDRTWYGKGNNGEIPTNHACYIEIPVPAGDYVIGYDGADTKVRNGYLMYLDIGANGEGSGETGYSMDKVRFINYSGMPSDGNGNVNVSGYEPALITLSGSSTAEEIAVFKRDEDETDGKLKLAYRIINNNANAIKVNETTKNMTREDTTLTPSTDDEQ